MSRPELGTSLQCLLQLELGLREQLPQQGLGLGLAADREGNPIRSPSQRNLEVQERTAAALEIHKIRQLVRVFLGLGNPEPVSPV